MAAWCYITRQSPEVYRALPRRQRKAFLDMAEQLKQKGW